MSGPRASSQLCALGLVALCACAPQRADAPRGDPADAQRAVLRVGTSGDYAPFSADGEGFDIEVAKRLAAELGVQIEWVPFRWPELTQAMRKERFDIAMSGITWRPARALVGRMSRALASGGPCVIGAKRPKRVAVNRGGILERFARMRFGGQAQIVTVDDNRSLPVRLARGDVDAIVTDSFELAAFRSPGQDAACEPPLDRKVYWIAATRAEQLGARVDAFLRAHEGELDRLRVEYFGASAPRDDLDHLVDLLARRFAFMPAVAAWKRERGRAIEDAEREARVLERVLLQAARHGIAPEGAARLFRLQIELAKAIQRRTPADAPSLELPAVRTTLSELGDRILETLGRQLPLDPRRLDAERMAPLAALLEPAELAQLQRALTGLARLGAPAAGLGDVRTGLRRSSAHKGILLQTR